MRRKGREVKSFDDQARTAVVKIELDEITGKHHLKK